MSTLETNSIGKYNGNNVSIDDPLRLKIIQLLKKMHLQLLLVIYYNSTDL